MTHFVKFIHILCALGLLGGTTYRFMAITFRLNKLFLLLAGLAILTGTLLIYPTHFTFHTPWIIAAYLLTFFYILGVTLSLFLKTPSRLIYFFLMVTLILIIHDAVTKTTLFL
jgi:hypothetical protein